MIVAIKAGAVILGRRRRRHAIGTTNSKDPNHHLFAEQRRGNKRF